MSALPFDRGAARLPEAPWPLGFPTKALDEIARKPATEATAGRSGFMNPLLSPLTRSPAHAFALGRIGVDLFDAGAFSSARDIFRLLVLERSHEPSGWYWLGRCHQELGQADVAKALFEGAARAGRSPLFRALARGVEKRKPR